jgi:hypothetical protein
LWSKRHASAESRAARARFSSDLRKKNCIFLHFASNFVIAKH